MRICLYFLFFIHRYFDEIFFTWNQSQDQLETFIHRMNMKTSSIQVKFTIGTEIDYLDAHIKFISDENDQSIILLETSVNHESNAEPYALPYIYHQPSNMIYSKLIRTALIRATLYCLDIYEFQQERQYIELSFTINGFPIGFICEHVTIFFLELNMEEFDYNVIQYDRKCIQKKLEQHCIV
jgi:hypothetical protein